MIEIVAGTNRPDANALKVAQIVQGYYRELGAETRILSLSEMPREIFDSSSYAQKPAAFLPIQQRVLDAAGLHFIVPEYNGSFPGVLKYFIDMLKFPESFEHKCVAFTGEAGGVWGAFRAVEQVQMIFSYRNAYILPERVWMPGINEKLNEEKTAIADVMSRERLEAQCAAFSEWVKRNGPRAS